jgi:hypothetical protein
MARCLRKPASGIWLFISEKGLNMSTKVKQDVHYDQRSIHQGGHSGLPIQPDGELRESSNAVPPVVRKQGGPVNPKK